MNLRFFFIIYFMLSRWYLKTINWDKSDIVQYFKITHLKCVFQQPKQKPYFRIHSSLCRFSSENKIKVTEIVFKHLSAVLKCVYNRSVPVLGLRIGRPTDLWLRQPRLCRGRFFLHHNCFSCTPNHCKYQFYPWVKD